ncbi:hypothetical protein WICPIJ_008037 [Wickerhamomyces pijperi]|uniref:Amino acid permease/ SLC12A domain-containing protein n=1 Tax=Wickerhamomyces pijperi TaxID=599730 RepID=A0A9P8PYN8_WICPI|nr:hypothetical protein WICPIJ_008037 [Wickerhamomyces pijperi]
MSDSSSSFTIEKTATNTSLREVEEVKDYSTNVVATQVKAPADSDSVNSGQLESVVKPNFFVTYWGNTIHSYRRKIIVEGEPDEAIDPESGKPNNKKISTVASKFIALGSGLGTGLLVGTGMALSIAGPAGLTLANIITCTLIVLTVMGGGELAISYPTLPGGFNAYPSLLVDPSLAFALAWSYCINWLLVLPLEMVTASMTIKYWNDSINPAVFITIFLCLIYSVNFHYGAKGYSSIELFFSSFKAFMLLSFIGISFSALCGNVPTPGNVGIKLYSEPGAFANGFKGVCACFITSAFSLGGTEAMILTAADQEKPRKSIPKSLKFVAYRVVVFYVLAVFFLGLMIAYSDSSLMGASHSSDAAPVSPFVLSVINCGIPIFNHIYNGIILCAIISVGNSAFYASSRTLHSLSVQGYNLEIFSYTDNEDRPLMAMIATAVVGLFSYIACYKDQQKIFVWLMSLSGMSTIFTWMSINLSHIRFRRALKVQSIGTDALGYKAPLGVFGSYIALISYFIICVVFFWTSLWPLGSDGIDVVNFFQNYMGLFTFLALYILHKCFRAYKGHKFIWFLIPASEIDLENQRVIQDKEQLEADDLHDAEQFKNYPLWKKILEYLF